MEIDRIRIDAFEHIHIRSQRWAEKGGSQVGSINMDPHPKVFTNLNNLRSEISSISEGSAKSHSIPEWDQTIFDIFFNNIPKLFDINRKIVLFFVERCWNFSDVEYLLERKSSLIHCHPKLRKIPY